MKSFRLAFKRLSTGVVLLQWFGNLAATLLAFLWLQIPDSHAWEFMFSILSAGLLVFAFLGLHAHTFRLLLPQDESASLWPRLFLLLLVIILGFFIFQGIDVGRHHEPLFAGYWNSRFSAGMRSFFTYHRLVQWQDYFYDLLQWLFAALLLPIAFMGALFGMRHRIWRQSGCVYRRIGYWLVVILAGILGELISSSVVSWTPGHGTAAEIASMLLRFGLVYTVDILLWCFVLATIAISADCNRSSEAALIP